MQDLIERARANAAMAWLAALAVLVLLLDAFALPPAFGHTDIYYFKDAALNFAEGSGLTSRFTYGNPAFEYKDFATYPPVYPLLFGLFARLFGISITINQLFNSLVGVALGLAVFVALRPALRSASPLARYPRLLPWLAVACFALRCIAPADDRPDASAAILGLTAVMLALRGKGVAAMLSAGLVSALTLFTSPFVGIWTSVLISIGILSTFQPARSKLKALAVVAAGGACAVITILICLKMWLPGWFDGFFGVASGSDTHNETGGGYFIALLHGDLRTWLSGFPYSNLRNVPPLLQLGMVSLALAGAIALRWPHPRAKRLLPLLAASPLCLITSPYQTHYPPVAALLLLVTWAALEIKEGIDTRPANALLGALLGLMLLAAPSRLQELAVREAAGASVQRATAEIDSNRAEFTKPGRFLAVAPSTYMLFRQLGLHPLISVYSGLETPSNRSRVQFVALAYPGSGSLTLPQQTALVSDGEYVPLFTPDLPQPVTAFGMRISNSSQTWESALFARRECEACLKEFEERHSSTGAGRPPAGNPRDSAGR